MTLKLERFKVETIEDALAVVQESGDVLPQKITNPSPPFKHGLSLSTLGSNAIFILQKGKKQIMQIILTVKFHFIFHVLILQAMPWDD